jgi:hypothetical protein
MAMEANHLISLQISGVGLSPKPPYMASAPLFQPVVSFPKAIESALV